MIPAAGLLIALAIALPLLLLATWADRRAWRRQQDALAAPPERGEDTVDSLHPTYITEDELAELPDKTETATARQPSGTEYAAKLADPAFATHGHRAELDNAIVLLLREPATTVRELLQPLSEATAKQPLVIVAPAFHDEVLETLLANRRYSQAQVFAMTAPATVVAELAELLTAQPLERSDLMAGYLPSEAWGQATEWLATKRSSFVAVEPSR